MSRRRFTHITAILFLAIVAACTNAPPATELPHQTAEPGAVLEVSAIYDATADRHLFVVNADTVPSGWTTIRFTNSSPMLHFVFLDHLPDGRTSADFLAEVSPLFQEAMDLTMAGRPDESGAVFAKLPEWFSGLVFRGGAGFTSPGHTTEATLYLEPGNYVMECYVKTADGVFHWNLGMHSDLHVTEEVSARQEPTNPTLQVTLTDTAMSIEGAVTRGDHLIAVHFQEDNPGLFGKDLHVARLDDGTTVEEVVAWMDASTRTGLVSTTDAQAPATFVGGVHDMPKGNTAYFKLTLEPGKYVWVSELPSGQSSYQAFTVPE